MLHAKGYSLVELAISLSISSLLLLSVGTLLIGFHQQTMDELKQAQLYLQSQMVNEMLRAEFAKSGFSVSEAISTSEHEVSLGYLSSQGFERVGLRAQDKKLKLCRSNSPTYQPIANVCSDVTNFSMLNDKLLSVESFMASKVVSHAVHLEYQLRLKGDTELYGQSLLLLPKGSSGGE